MFGSAAGLPPGPVKDPDVKGKKLSAWVADLSNKDVAVRRAATVAIGELRDPKRMDGGLTSESAATLIESLVRGLEDKDKAVRFGAARLLADEVWGSRYSDKRLTLTDTQRAKVLPVFLDALKDSAADVRVQAVASLPKVEPGQKVVLEPLAKMLKDPDEKVRTSAVLALRGVKPSAAAVPALVGALDDESVGVRTEAARALAAVGPPAEPAVPKLITLLKTDAAARSPAAEALGSIRESKLTVPALTDALKNTETRAAAVRGLGVFGPGAKAALPALLDVFKDSKGNARTAALEALFAIEPRAEACQAALITSLKDPDAAVQETAIELCERYASKATLPALLDVFQTSTGNTRAEALSSLFAVDSESEVARSALLAALKDVPGPKDLKKRIAWTAAIRICVEQGPKAKAAVPVIVEVLTAKDVPATQKASLARALRRMGPAAEPAVPALIALFNSEKDVRWDVAEVLGAIGPPARTAVSAMREVLKAEEKNPASEDLVDTIRSALKKIEKEPVEK
jgi:HEAT repeat protein